MADKSLKLVFSVALAQDSTGKRGLKLNVVTSLLPLVEETSFFTVIFRYSGS